MMLEIPALFCDTVGMKRVVRLLVVFAVAGLAGCGPSGPQVRDPIPNDPDTIGDVFALAFFQADTYLMKRVAHNTLHAEIEKRRLSRPLDVSDDVAREKIILDQRVADEGIVHHLYAVEGGKRRLLVELGKFGEHWLVTSYTQNLTPWEKIRAVRKKVENVGRGILRDATAVITGD